MTEQLRQEQPLVDLVAFLVLLQALALGLDPRSSWYQARHQLGCRVHQIFNAFEILTLIRQRGVQTGSMPPQKVDPRLPHGFFQCVSGKLLALYTLWPRRQRIEQHLPRPEEATSCWNVGSESIKRERWLQRRPFANVVA